MSTKDGKPIPIPWMSEGLARLVFNDLPDIGPPDDTGNSPDYVYLLFGPGGVGPAAARMDELKDKVDDEDLDVISSMTGVYFQDNSPDILASFARKLARYLRRWCACW